MIWKSVCGCIHSRYEVQLPSRLEGSNGPTCSLSCRGSLFIVYRIGVKGVLDTEEGSGALDAHVAQAECGPAHVLAPPSPSLLERWGDRGLGRFGNLLKAPSLGSAGTRILTEICFTCLHTCPLDFDVDWAGWWPPPLRWVDFSLSSCFSELLPATRAAAGSAFLFQCILQIKIFPAAILEAHSWYQERSKFIFPMGV